MPPRTKPRRTKPSVPTPSVPDPQTALPELTRREVRAFIALLVRAVLVAFLSVVLARQVPGFRAYRLLWETVGGTLVLWPYLTTLGRVYEWRIHLGRAYARAAQWENARRTLAPLIGPRGALFDAVGEGRYFLAAALRGVGEAQKADRLLQTLGVNGRSPWRERAERGRETSDAVGLVQQAEDTP